MQRGWLRLMLRWIPDPNGYYENVHKQKNINEKPLSFHVSTIQISRFAGPPDGNAGTTTIALSIFLCQAINNCDTMFVFSFRDALQNTICTNPYVLDLLPHAGEYGSYPTQPFSTYVGLKNTSILSL